MEITLLVNDEENGCRFEVPRTLDTHTTYMVNTCQENRRRAPVESLQPHWRVRIDSAATS